jgi:hypothetical protein
MRVALTRDQWRTVAVMAAAILALHVVGFFVLIVLVAPRRRDRERSRSAPA